MFGNFRHIIALLFVIALAGGFYYLATSDNAFTQYHDRAALIDEKTENLKKEIITPLNLLSAITMDQSLFASPEYKTLQDMSVTLNPPVLVRSNPFAPVR